ncbi:hypothetical protein SAMN05444172_3828 [Burkholderia sp. GAS332]|nr:hypothetical protein SAMN05444172_3828 [Burkholderia sp. GAS332]
MVRGRMPGAGGHGLEIRGDASFVEVKQESHLGGVTGCAWIPLDSIAAILAQTK